MKKFLQKNRVCTVLFVVLFFGLLKSPVNGQEKTEEFIYTHTHEDTCFLMQVINCEADGVSYGEIIERKTCQLCGDELHYYRFQTKCSCGAFFDHTGFACMNSPYGSNVGDCPNYEVVEGTMHAHEERVQICPLTEEETVAKVAVYRSVTGMTREKVTLRLVMEKGSGSAVFAESQTSELSVSENGAVMISIFYEEHLKHKSANHTISVNNIDRAVPVLEVQISPKEWKEGNCVVTVQASDPSDGVNAVSGIAQNGYSFDGGKTWREANTMEFSSTVRSEIWVRDNAGNISRQAFFAEKTEPPTEETTELGEAPSEESTERMEELPSGQRKSPETGTEEPEENSEQQKSVALPVEKLWKEKPENGVPEASGMETDGEETVVAYAPLDTKKGEAQDMHTQEAKEHETIEGKESSFSFGRMWKRMIRWMQKPAVTVSLSAASLVGGVLLLAGYYFLLGLGTVSCMDVTGAERFVAKIVVRRKKGKWRIVIDEDMAMRCKTKSLVLYVSLHWMGEYPPYHEKIFLFCGMLGRDFSFLRLCGKTGIDR